MRAGAKLGAFGAVGSIGFVTDAAILTVLSQSVGLNVYAARIVSFGVATVATWLLNRTFVFRTTAASTASRGREYRRYLLVQVGGALLNLAVFAVALALHPPFRAIPVIPLAMGAVLGMVFNFAGSQLWVFKSNS